MLEPFLIKPIIWRGFTLSNYCRIESKTLSEARSAEGGVLNITHPYEHVPIFRGVLGLLGIGWRLGGR